MGSNPASPTITVEAVCGRFVGSYSVLDVVEELQAAASAAGLMLDLPDTTLPLMRNFNVAPTTAVPVLVEADGMLRAEVMQWGLVPSWSNDSRVGAKMINARAETVTEKVSFRTLVRGNRCIVVLNGFYEWQRSGDRPKVPYFVGREDSRLMLAAGVWTRSPIIDAGTSFAMLTRESIEDLSAIHHRTPVHLFADDAVEWMQGELPVEATLDAHRQPRLRCHEVSTDVNSVRNNREDLMTPWHNAVEPDDQPTLF